MLEMMKKFWSNPFFVPVALFLITVISFAPIIHTLGFYWDDWPSIWYLHFQGAESFHDNFAADRPLFGWIFRLTTSIMGESALAWQIFAIFTRWLTTLGFWWVLQLVWPENKTQVAWTAFLFAIYPSFRQQFIAVTYSNAFLVYFLFFLSFATMILAIKRPRWYWPLMIISILSSGLSMFIAEYFFGLELLRPIVLWFIQKDKVMTPFQKNQADFPRNGSFTLFYCSPSLIWVLFLRETPAQ